ncbi:unnamed protein product [Calypogeia fissa]
MEFIAATGKGKSQLPPHLILPALSIGNVGQLAVDLLISSRTVTKAGYLDDPYVLPCVGNDPFGPEADGTLAVSLEVFEDSESELAIVQQRSPVVKGKMVDYAKNIADWAGNSGVKEVFIVSGLDAAKRQRREMVGPQIQYISTSKPDGSDEICDQLGWKRLEQAGQLFQHQAALSEESSSSSSPSSSQVVLTDENYYAGLPFASLYSSCKAKGLNVVCILLYCSEGDNTPDAFFAVESLQHLLQQRKVGNFGNVQWRIPLSWETVYGPPPDDSIF